MRVVAERAGQSCLRPFLSALLCVVAQSAFADSLPVYGSPGYTPGVGGFIVDVGSVDFLDKKIAVNNSGTAASSVDRHDGAGAQLDRRAVRWNATSAVELDDFGEWEGLAFVNAADINEAGQTIGDSVPGNFEATLAIRWSGPGTAATRMDPTNGFIDRYGRAINNSGVAVGYGDFPSRRAIRWDSPTLSVVLDYMPTFYSTQALEINDAGTVLGLASRLSNTRAIRWNPAGIATELGNLGFDVNGETAIRPFSMNSAGAVVGRADKYDASGNSLGTAPVRWDASPAAITELATLGVDLDGKSYGEARDLNDSGVAVGNAREPSLLPTDGNATLAARWAANGTAITPLGHLGAAPDGSINASAYAINSSGLTVGTASTYNATTDSLDQHAVAWRSSGVAIDLNTLIDPASGWVLANAYDVSDGGWIAGDGYYDPDGVGGEPAYGRYFVLQLPPPEQGDFNEDGSVDAEDLASWRTGFGASGDATHSQGDADGDLDVDGADFLVWQQQLGSGVTGGAAVAPEPSGWLTCLVAAAGFMRLRRELERYAH